MVEEEVYNKALVAASRNGHAALIEALVAAGADVNEGRENRTKDYWFEDESYHWSDGDTALIVAAQRRQKECIESLVRLRANVNKTGERGRTALIEAVRRFDDDIHIPRLLIEAGSDVNIEDDSGWTALDYASSKGYMNTVTLLLQYGADVKRSKSALAQASCIGNEAIMKLLIESGADINASKWDGETALFKAASEGRRNIVEVLIKAGANLNGDPSYAGTPLMAASSKGHLEIVRALLEAGADVNLSTRDGNTALIKASACGNLDIVKLLAQAGADVNLCTSDGKTALMRASACGDLDIVKLLAQAGANVNSASGYKRDDSTAIIIASSCGHVEIVKYLIEAGANVNFEARKDRNSGLKKIALAEASSNGHFETAKVLIKSGANANHIFKDGLSALMMTVSRGHISCIKFLMNMQKAGYFNINALFKPIGSHDRRERFSYDKYSWMKRHNLKEYSICCDRNENQESAKSYLSCVKLLIDSGADVNKATKNGWTALMMASLDGHTDIVRLLIDARANVNATCRIDWSSLIFAIVGNHYKCTEALLQAGADVNIKVFSSSTALKHRKTALGYAVDIANVEMVKLLLLFGSRLRDLRMGDEDNSKIKTLLKPAGFSNTKKEDTFYRAITDEQQMSQPKDALNLKDECRKVIRCRLFAVHPFVNMIYKVRQLGLPSILNIYCSESLWIMVHSHCPRMRLRPRARPGHILRLRPGHIPGLRAGHIPRLRAEHIPRLRPGPRAIKIACRSSLYCTDPKTLC